MEMNDSTVVTEYEPIKRKSDSYQSEQALENEFIRLLTEQGYDYLEIHDSESLIKNLRTQLEIVNDYKFTDSEWDRFFNDSIANNNDGIVEKTRKIQEVNKHVEDVNRQIEQMNQVMKLGIKAMLAHGMSLELISKSLSKSEDEIMELLK